MSLPESCQVGRQMTPARNGRAGEVRLDISRFDASPTKGPGYLTRVLRFHLVWVVLLLLTNWVATIVAPDPDVIYSYYGFLMSIAYLVLVVVLAPVSVVTGLAVRWAIQQSRWSPRLVALLCVAAMWAVLIGVGLAVRSSSITDVTTLQCAITLGISLPVFGLLMPVPPPVAGPSDER